MFNYIVVYIIQRLYSYHIVFKAKSCTFYQKACLDGACPWCGGMALLRKCVHVSDDHELGWMEVNSQRFDYITYHFEGGKSGRKIQLVSTQVSSYCTMKFYIFSLKIYINMLAHFQCTDIYVVVIILPG